MKRIFSPVLCMALLFSNVNVTASADEIQPITGGDVGTIYKLNIGNEEVTGSGTYNYSDSYISIRTAIGNGDKISTDGIYFSGPSCKEPPTNASEANRYILLKSAYDGVVTLSVQFTNASSSAKGRIWVNSFGPEDFDDVDLTKLQKGVGTQLGSDASDSKAQTVSFDVTAGQTYSLHTYNRTSYIYEMYYDTDEITSTPSPIPSPVPTPIPYDGNRKVEYLDRGLVAVRVENGVFLSWRLLGWESTDTTFDIYKNGELLKSDLENTNFTDCDGFENDEYQVVISGNDPTNEKKAYVLTVPYIDIPISRPVPDLLNDKAGTDYTYSANDASVADLDGDGEYEFILKWDPSNSQDNYFDGYTGNVYVDAYKVDGTFMWRIDLGVNIRAGAHYTQFIAYDFDGDGKAEVAMRTAPGSKDANGEYVTRVGKNITECDDTKDYRNTDGRITTAPDYLTMFSGETGAAMQTVDYYVQRGDLGASSGWGGGATDNGSYSERYLAGLAYLNGETPSLIMCRGYYYRATVGAYNWDGEDFELIWKIDDKNSGSNSLYGKGAHSLSVADVDFDGRDEIVYGAAVIDDDGTMLYETDLQHGDALHVSDFNNDGKQEVFMVHEHGYSKYGAEIHDAQTGEIFVCMGASEDVGRGVMDNIIASNEGSEFWSNANGNLYDQNGKVLTKQKPAETNFLVWWDGDLTREILDVTRIVKYDIENGNLVSERLLDMYGVHSNNGTKQTPSLSADIFGDWREEVVYPTNDNNYLRVYTTTIPTEHKLTTLMHDTQYRCAVAWQNVGYNQPPHTSFYIGEEKSDYPSPAVEFACDADISQNKTDNEIQYCDIIPRETFSSSTDEWQGEIITVDAPYKEVLSVSGTMDKMVNVSAEGGVYHLELLWKPQNNGSQIRILNENNESIFEIEKSENSLICTSGNGQREKIGSIASKFDWYSIEVDIDLNSQLVNCEVKDYSVPSSETVTVKNVSFSDVSSKRIGAIRMCGDYYLDNFRLAQILYTAPRYLATFEVSQADAQITVDGETITTNKDGKAYITLKDNAKYDVKVSKPGYRTYTTLISISGADVTERIELLSGEERAVYVRCKNSDGEVIKDYELVGNAVDNELFSIPEELSEDIEYNGAFYEYSADLTEKITTVVDGDTYLDLVYVKRNTPVYGDASITRINLSENGFGKENVIAPNVEYKSFSNGAKMGMFRNIGNEKIEISLNEALIGNSITEFDLLIENMDDNTELTVTPCSGENKGNPIRISAEDEKIALKDFSYTDDDIKKSGYATNQLLRIIIAKQNDETKLSLVNRDSSKVYIDEQLYDIGIEETDKLVFERGTNNGTVSIGLAEIKAYIIGGATQATYPCGEEINMIEGMQKSIAPISAVHCTDFGNTAIDLKNGLSYSIDGGNGYVSIDETGTVSVLDGAKTGRYKANIMYNGHIFKTITVNVVNGTLENIWSEDFEGDTHKFSLVYPTNSMAQFHCEDPSKNNKADGYIYGVGARKGGNTGTNSSEIVTDGYSDISVEMDFKIDATAYNSASYISFLGAANTNDSLSSDKQILTVRAFAGGGNGYWSTVSVNGIDFVSQIDTEGNTNGETAGAGYYNGSISFGVLNRDTTGWLHLSAALDFERQKVNVVISKKSSGEIMYSGEVDFVNEVSELKYIFASGGKQYGTTWLDNISIMGIKIDEESVKTEVCDVRLNNDKAIVSVNVSENESITPNIYVVGYDTNGRLEKITLHCETVTQSKDIEVDCDAISGCASTVVYVWSDNAEPLFDAVRHYSPNTQHRKICVIQGYQGILPQ